MAEYVNEDKPMIIVNETDSDFNVGVGVIFRKSGIYEISVNDKTTVVTKVSERKTGRWIEDDDEMFVICSECGEENDYISAFCPNCGAYMVTEDGG